MAAGAMALFHHRHVEAELLVDVALERAATHEVSKTPEGAAKRVEHLPGGQAYRSTSDTALAKRSQLSVSL